MIQLTEEQSGRLKQIRERQMRSMRPDRDDVPQRSADPLARALSRELRQAQTDRGFLLSLLESDSPAANCALCGGPHDFDTSIPSVVWNAVIRARDLPDYLCATCIVREFVRVGQGFTAELWNEEFNGVPIEVVVNGQNAKDASLIQKENNSLRNQINDAAQSIVNEADKVGQLMQSAATSMRDKCVYELGVMKAEDEAAGTYPQGRGIYASIAKRLESLTLEPLELEK